MNINVGEFYKYMNSGFTLIIKHNLFTNIIKCELSDSITPIPVRKDLAQRQIKLGRISLYKKTSLYNIDEYYYR
jgi:hypothetical protein